MGSGFVSKKTAFPLLVYALCPLLKTFIFSELIDSVARKKPQIIERQVFPVLWNFLSSQNAPSGVLLRREIAELAHALHSAFGRRLYDLAESQNLAQKLKNVLES